MKRAVFAFLFLVLGSVWARSDVMMFQAFPPDEAFRLLMNDYAWRIFATGEIDDDAGKRLAELLAQKKIPVGSRLYLNSPGGSLVGGMALGRVIREYRLKAFIGQRDTSLKYIGAKAGYCYSACATAFLGGDFRYWTEGSVYGVHRFFWESNSANDAALAQIMSAALVEYIRSMGVDTKIFALASQAGSSEVITPPHEVLLALNVVNDGRKPPKWTIESAPQGIYLKGEQETDNGINKFMLVCSPSEPTMLLYAIFDGGTNAERDIRWPVNWLFLDHSPIRLDKQLISKDIKNGMINLVYRVDSNLIAAISRAKFTRRDDGAPSSPSSVKHGPPASLAASDKWAADHVETGDNYFSGPMGYAATAEALRQLIPVLRDALSKSSPEIGAAFLEGEAETAKGAGVKASRLLVIG